MCDLPQPARQPAEYSLPRPVWDHRSEVRPAGLACGDGTRRCRITTKQVVTLNDFGQWDDYVPAVKRLWKCCWPTYALTRNPSRAPPSYGRKKMIHIAS